MVYGNKGMKRKYSEQMIKCKGRKLGSFLLKRNVKPRLKK